MCPPLFPFSSFLINHTWGQHTPEFEYHFSTKRESSILDKLRSITFSLMLSFQTLISSSGMPLHSPPLSSCLYKSSSFHLLPIRLLKGIHFSKEKWSSSHLECPYNHLHSCIFILFKHEGLENYKVPSPQKPLAPSQPPTQSSTSTSNPLPTT